MSIEEKEWTIMFYFASDNSLAPEIVSQLKSIKQAGYHPEANVIARFDPNTENTPTHVFDINRFNKLKAQYEVDQDIKIRETESVTGGQKKERDPVYNYRIGHIGRVHNDPYVVDIMRDKIWEKEEDAEGNSIKKQIEAYLKKELQINYSIPKLPKYPKAKKARPQDAHVEPDPEASLTNFLKFCSNNYPARHYMLFILGHGVVVGNDIFLLDEHAARPSLTLKELGDVLKKFKDDIKTPRDGAENAATAQFELVGFHSCSMSSLEMAYELEGKVNYMLASQGPAFVNSWSYRQILIRVFNDLTEKGDRAFSDKVRGKAAVRQMLTRIFAYCHYNSYDFLVAGYSYDICLCDLNRLKDIKESLYALISTLIKALRTGDSLVRERILLAHWDAQSYWMENYTDLYDFCFRLSKRCLKGKTEKKAKLLHPSLKNIFDSCREVMKSLEKEAETSKHRKSSLFEGFYKKAVETAAPKPAERFIVRSDFTGPLSQYSNGMSVYFPWTKPVQAGFLEEYQKYRFVKNYKTTSWLDFLLEYFKHTRRKTRSSERGKGTQPPSLAEKLVEEFAECGLEEFGQLSTAPPGEKPGPGSPMGAAYGSPSLKNHPPYLRERKEAVGKNKS